MIRCTGIKRELIPQTKNNPKHVFLVTPAYAVEVMFSSCLCVYVCVSVCLFRL